MMADRYVFVCLFVSRVFPNIKDLGRTRIEVRVSIKSLYPSKLCAMKLLVKIPVPKYTAKARFEVSKQQQ